MPGKASRLDPFKLKSRGRARMGRFAIAEGIIERLADACFDIGVTVKGNGFAETKRKQTQIIQSEQMVGMLVREEHTVDEGNFLSEQLRTQIRWRVDQDRSGGRVDRDRTTSSIVSRIVALTDLALATDRWHANTRTSTQKNHGRRCSLRSRQWMSQALGCNPRMCQ